MADLNPDVPVCRDPSPQNEHQDTPPGPGNAASNGRAGRHAPVRLERWLFQQTLAAIGGPPLAVVFANDEPIAYPPDGTPPVARIIIRSRRILWRLIADPLFQFGEAFATGELELQGDLLGFLRQLDRSLLRSPRLGLFNRMLARWFRRPRRNTLAGSRDNIHHHYDIGNEFYKLWLDERLVYTCAYFASPDLTLEEAQAAKMDLVCRKLRLQPGEAVIEAGCGWGSLALHMARHYGVTVRAYNISREQIAYARERAAAEGLQDRVEYVEDDWRNISGRCDAFVSVGMLEHVGVENYRLLGDVIHRCLKPTGRGLIHSIGQNKPNPFDPWTERRIFPGAYPPTLAEMMQIFEGRDFSVLDIENLRLHYAETLKHWLKRYEDSAETVREMFDEQFVRMWRLYLAGSVAAFETGSLQLFQMVFAPGANNKIPWTRDYLSRETDRQGAEVRDQRSEVKSQPGSNSDL